MEMSYTRFSRGLYASQREFEQNSQGYFQESRRYQRPIATNFYSNPGVMFDQHTYPKGGSLLFALRKQIGENAFYKGLHQYLTVYKNTPVDTNDLERSMTQATGIDMQPWFTQWILKPGHPVIDWSWTYDGKQALVSVKQIQDRSHGAPIYDVPTKIALLYNSGTKHILRMPVRLNQADQTYAIPTTQKPDAVVFDADQDFLREIKNQPWKQDELVAVVRYAPNCVDKQTALNRLLSNSPSDADVNAVVEFLRGDRGLFPAIADDSKLSALKKPELRSFFENELQHECLDRRAHAVEALAELPATVADNELLREHVNDHEYYRVVGSAIRALGKLDFAGSESLLREQAASATNGQVRAAALQALVEHDAPGAGDLVFAAMDDSMPDSVQNAAVLALMAYKRDDDRVEPALRKMLQSNNFQSIFGALQVAANRKMKGLLPDLEALKKRNPRTAPMVDQTVQKISS